VRVGLTKLRMENHKKKRVFLTKIRVTQYMFYFLITKSSTQNCENELFAFALIVLGLEQFFLPHIPIPIRSRIPIRIPIPVANCQLLI